MTTLRSTLMAAAAVGMLVSPAAAQVVPEDVGGPHCLSPAFGAAACSLTDEYLGAHLRFEDTATFDDGGGVYAWGGINASGEVDLIAPVIGSLWSTDGATQMFTNYLRVEAGFSNPATLQLDVYDLFGALVGSRLNGMDGVGPHGRDYIEINAAGIHSFRVWTPGDDSFGVNQIEYGALVPGQVVPEPMTMVLLGTGLVGMAVVRRRRLGLEA